MTVHFDQLVSALARAVVEAEHRVQQTHIGDIWSYFQKDGTPISVELQIPRGSPESDRQETTKVRVPLITLVNPSQMSIQEMQVSMQVDMNEILKDTQMKQKPNKEETGDQHYAWKAPEYTAMIAASTATGKKPGEAGMAQITLRVAAGETPEGLARLLDHLNKCL